MTSLTTARLLLRPFAEGDSEDFASLNADPRVRQFFPSVLDHAESDASAARYVEHWARYGFGRWTVEVPGVTHFAGVVGLSNMPFETHFSPAVEIGWRMVYDFWGFGYAIEAARASCQFGFDALGLAEIVAFTVPTNTPSRRVMERLGMRYAPGEDFDHPLLQVGHPLTRHVLYRLPRSDLVMNDAVAARA